MEHAISQSQNVTSRILHEWYKTSITIPSECILYCIHSGEILWMCILQHFISVAVTLERQKKTHKLTPFLCKIPNHSAAIQRRKKIACMLEIDQLKKKKRYSLVWNLILIKENDSHFPMDMSVKCHLLSFTSRATGRSAKFSSQLLRYNHHPFTGGSVDVQRSATF